jgi:DNA repair protein RecN (Recombination protein N)
MLLHLKIRDFAIIDAALLEIPPGFTVITGETGAGKSILIDALVLALGGRASNETIRTGASSAEVEALFDISQQPLIKERLAARDLVGDDPDVLLVRRVVGAKGKAKVLVNGFLSTVATLGEIVRGLVDISGQHEQLSLLQLDTHLDIVDSFGAVSEAKHRYQAAYARLRALRRERDNLQRNADEMQKRADYLRFQLDEIERLAPQAGEDGELEAERRRLAHAEKLKQGAEVAEALLYGEDGSAFDKLGKATAEVEALSRIDDDLRPTLEALASARREIEEAARTLQRYGGHIEADPRRLESIEERLAALQRVCRKHGGGVPELLAKKSELSQELDGVENVDARLDELAKQVAVVEQEAVSLARELSQGRAKAAARLDAAILDEVADMELADAVFHTRLRERAAAADAITVGEVTLAESGMDDVEFLWSANKGEAPRALARIVSGGELSRLMLAVKRVLARCDLVSLYVFDEVDTGLGGKAADSIGRKIQQVALHHQAVTITHLAPIAARADHHLCVTKEVRGDRTVSSLRMIAGPERVEELARMIDGAKLCKTTLDAARVMLARSQRHDAAAAGSAA